MSRIYFAGPLFCKSEKDFNAQLTAILEDAGYDVFLPQRDGFEAAQLQGLSPKEVCDKIFNKDTSEIKDCDIFFMILDGCVPDPGACVELGIAHSLDKRCYGFKTDTRSLELNVDLNPLIEGCFSKIFKDTDGDKLIKTLIEYLKKNQL